MGNLTLISVETVPQSLRPSQCIGKALIGDIESIFYGDVCQSISTRLWHVTRNIGNAVVQNIFFNINWIVMCSRTNRFDTTTLIDSKRLSEDFVGKKYD